MNQNLSLFTCLPKLVNGKVCIINADESYTLLKPTVYTSISDNFNPLNYAILIHEKYPKCIVYAKRADMEYALVQKQLMHMKETMKSVKVGTRIHLHQKDGMYTVVSTTSRTVEITCRRWQTQGKPNMVILWSEIKCLAGGLNNYGVDH